MEVLDLHDNNLSGEITPELGGLDTLIELDLSKNWLMGAIPPELGNLANLKVLDLSDNNISGEFPRELGKLTNLKILGLEGLHLSGCTATELAALSSHFDTTCSVRDALAALYRATDGPNWKNNSNWLSDRPFGEWYGVVSDGRGRVTNWSSVRTR